MPKRTRHCCKQSTASKSLTPAAQKLAFNGGESDSYAPGPTAGDVSGNSMISSTSRILARAVAIKPELLLLQRRTERHGRFVRPPAEFGFEVAAIGQRGRLQVCRAAAGADDRYCCALASDGVSFGKSIFLD